MNGLADKVAIVTGGASGLGRALCEALCAAGARCVIADIDVDGATALAERLTQAGGRAVAQALDVTSAEAVTALVDGVVESHGCVDLMFNNAGVIVGGEVRDMSLDHWRRLIDVNLNGVVYGTAAAYSRMVRQGHGHIVNISSVSGLIALPIYSGYAMTKHAIVGLSTSLRAEGAALGVGVSVVCPGQLRTGLSDAAVVINARREDIPSAVNQERLLLDPAVAAARILRGVERNQRIIVFPLSSRILWWLDRFWPGCLRRLESRIVANFRVARTGP